MINYKQRCKGNPMLKSSTNKSEVIDIQMLKYELQYKLCSMYNS